MMDISRLLIFLTQNFDIITVCIIAGHMTRRKQNMLAHFLLRSGRRCIYGNIFDNIFQKEINANFRCSEYKLLK
jgi:hypothetical protein